MGKITKNKNLQCWSIEIDKIHAKMSRCESVRYIVIDLAAGMCFDCGAASGGLWMIWLCHAARSVRVMYHQFGINSIVAYHLAYKANKKHELNKTTEFPGTPFCNWVLDKTKTNQQKENRKKKKSQTNSNPSVECIVKATTLIVVLVCNFVCLRWQCEFLDRNTIVFRSHGDARKQQR